MLRRKSRKPSPKTPQGNSILEVRGISVYTGSEVIIFSRDCYKIGLDWMRGINSLSDLRVFLDGREQFPPPSAR